MNWTEDNGDFALQTPLTIQLAIAIYCGGDPIGNVPFDWFSEPATNAREWMRSEDLIDDGGTNLTDRGKAWVEAICETPLPVKTWVMPSRQD